MSCSRRPRSACRCPAPRLKVGCGRTEPESVWGVRREPRPLGCGSPGRPEEKETEGSDVTWCDERGCCYHQHHDGRHGCCWDTCCSDTTRSVPAMVPPDTAAFVNATSTVDTTSHEMLFVLKLHMTAVCLKTVQIHINASAAALFSGSMWLQVCNHSFCSTQARVSFPLLSDTYVGDAAQMATQPV